MHHEKSICYKTKQILAKLEEEPGETGGRYSQCSCDYVSEFFFIFSANSENSCMGRSKKGPTLVKTLKFGWDIGCQSWNPAFYPLRSPDPLPSASGSGNLTTLWGAIKSSPLGLSHISRTYFRLLCFTFIAQRCYCFQNDCFLFFAQIICLLFYPVLPQNMIVDVAGKLVFPPWPLVSRRYDRTYATPPPIKISLCGKTSSFRMNKYLITVLCCKKLIVSDE